MKRYHMFEIFASEEGVYFASTDEKAQDTATKMFFEDLSNDSPPDIKIPSWPKSSKVLGSLQKLKLELGMNGWEPFAVTQKGPEINYFFRREVAD
jgi:hypothetical protein